MPIDAPTLIAALAPVLLILGLGVAAGKHRSFDADQVRGFSHLALTYALPAALFLSMAHFNRQTLIAQVPVALIMLAGYSGLYLVLYGLLRALNRSRLEAALFGFTFSSSSVPVYGLTILTPIYGADTGSAVVGLVSLITNLAQISIAVFLLESAASDDRGNLSLAGVLGRAALSPLVWAPVLGVALSLTGLHLSPYVSATLQPLASSASGVAIFAAGLVIASHRAILSPVVVIGALVITVVQPAIFFGGISVLGLSGEIPKAAVVASAFPNATVALLFAQQYHTAQREVASIMLLTTAAMILSLPLAMLATGQP